MSLGTSTPGIIVFDLCVPLAQLDTTHALFGLAAAATAAMFWAGATVMYRRIGRVLPPVRMNLTKNLLATVLLCAVVGGAWALSPDRGQPFTLARPMMLLLILSEIVGIGIGDTCFFAALARAEAKAKREKLELELIQQLEAEGLGRALGMVRDGLLLKEIANALGVSEGAIKQRLKNAKKKLGAKTSTQAAATAAQHGLI